MAGRGRGAEKGEATTAGVSERLLFSRTEPVEATPVSVSVPAPRPTAEILPPEGGATSAANHRPDPQTVPPRLLFRVSPERRRSRYHRSRPCRPVARIALFCTGDLCIGRHPSGAIVALAEN